MTKLLTLMRCGSCRFTAFYFLPFYVALLDSGAGGWEWLAFGAVFWLLHCLGVELLNRLSDQVEDRVNRLERTALCELVGYPQIKIVSILIWITIAGVYVGWVTLRPNLVLGTLLSLALLAGVNYSYGIRLKGRSWISNVALTFPFGGPFLIGWSVHHSSLSSAALQNLLYHAGPFLLVVGFFIGTFVGVKDITDIEGDERVGYQSFWVALIKKNAGWLIAALIASPFLAILPLVNLNLLPYRFFSLLLFLPVSAFFSVCVRSAREPPEREAAREFLYHYLFVFLASALFLYVPKRSTFWVIMGTSLYWVLASQYLHWSGGIRTSNLRVLATLAGSRVRVG